MANDVKIELALDGEKEFNQAIKSINGELKNMQSGVKAVDAANRGAANSQGALADKVKALGDAAKVSEKKVRTLDEIVRKQKQSQLDAAKAIDEVKAKFGEGSKEVQKAENAYRIATDSVNKWETKLNEAQVEYANINAELAKNQGYLAEAKSSVDKTASSIDEYGKAIKEAGDQTGDLTASTVAQVGAMEAMEKVSQTLSDTIGKIGDAAFDAAKELDEGYDTITKKTGATGSDFKEFKKIANDIAGSLPEDMEDVGAAVGEVSTRFKQSGKQLDATSKQFLKFAKINETDVSDAIDDVQVAMSAFKVDTRDAGKVLDVLTRTGQNTGAKVGALSQKLTQNATAFQELGLTIYGAIGFMGQLEVAGVEAEGVLSGLKRALKNATDDGVPFKEALADLEDQIKNGTESTDGLARAYELFGKNGAGVFQAVKNGNISFKDLADSTEILTDSVGSLDSAYEGTLDGWDKMTIAANNLKIAGSELTGAFFDAASPVIDGFTGIVQDLTQKFTELPDEVQTVIGVIGGVGSIAARVAPEVVNFVTQIMTLKAMRTLTADADGLKGGLTRLKSGFAGLRGASGYIGIAAGAIAALSAALADANNAIEASHTWTKEFRQQGEELLDQYEKERVQIETVQERLSELTTSKEKLAYLDDEIAKATEAENTAREAYNKTLNASRNVIKMTEEAEHSFWGEVLFNGSNAAYVAGKAYEDLADKKLDLSQSTYQQIEQATAEKNRIDDVTAGMEAESEALQKATADKEMLLQKRQEVVQAAAQEVTAAQQAAEASITAAGEELTAWQNLSSGQQVIAGNIAESVGAMKDSITQSVESVGNFFEAVAEKEEVHADQMKANFRAQIDEIKSWEENLAFLADKGINKELLQYMADMGPQAAQYVAAMKEDVINGADATVNEWNSLYQEKLDLGGAVNAEANDLLTQIGELGAGTEAKFAEIAEELNAATNKDGEYIVAGLVDGIRTAQSQAESAGETLGSATTDAVSAGAEVNSPSKATISVGRDIDQGLINGMAQQQGAVTAKAREVATATITAINSANLPAAAARTGADIGRSVTSGITAQQAAATAAIAALVGAISRTLQTQAREVYTAAVEMMRQASTGISTTASASQAAATAAGKGLSDSVGSGIASGNGPSAASSMAASVSANARAVDTTGAYWAGYYLAHGMAGGINAGASAAVNAAAQMAQRAIQAAQTVLQIHSPSKVFEKIGRYTGAGFVKGITRMIKPAINASKNLTRSSVKEAQKSITELMSGESSDYAKSAQKIVDKYTSKISSGVQAQTDSVERQVKRYFQIYEQKLDKEQSSLQKQIDKLNKKKDDKDAKAQAKKLQKQLNQLKTYSDKFKKIQSQLGRSIGTELSEALEKQTARVTDQLSSKIKTYAEQMQAEMNAVNNLITDMRGKLAGYGELFEIKNTTWERDVFSLTDLNSQIKTIEQYSKQITKLKGKISDDLMSEITSMGVDDAIKYTSELLSMSAKDLKEYNRLYSKKVKLAKDTANNFYADKVKEIQDNYTAKVEAAFKQASDKIKTYGQQAVAGFISGMKTVDIDVDVEKSANTIITKFKKALKIKSPSKVFAEEIGKPSGQGIMAGIEANTSVNVDGLVHAFKRGLPDMSQYAAATPQVYVYLGDRELSAILSASVIKQISGGVRAYNAAGGRR